MRFALAMWDVYPARGFALRGRVRPRCQAGSPQLNWRGGVCALGTSGMELGILAHNQRHPAEQGEERPVHFEKSQVQGD